MNTISIAKAGSALVVDFSGLPSVSQTYVIEYGLRQSLNDATASLKREDFKSDEEFRAGALAAAKKKLDGILSGELRQSVGRIGDPIEAEYMRLAIAKVADAIVKKGGKLKDYKMSDLRARALTIADKQPELAAKLRAKAEEIVSTRTADDEIEVTL